MSKGDCENKSASFIVVVAKNTRQLWAEMVDLFFHQKQKLYVTET